MPSHLRASPSQQQQQQHGQHQKQQGLNKKMGMKMGEGGLKLPLIASETTHINITGNMADLSEGETDDLMTSMNNIPMPSKLDATRSVPPKSSHSGSGGGTAGGGGGGGGSGVEGTANASESSLHYNVMDGYFGVNYPRMNRVRSQSATGLEDIDNIEYVWYFLVLGFF